MNRIAFLSILTLLTPLLAACHKDPQIQHPSPNTDDTVNLAINPETCIITHCNQHPGFETNKLNCETDQIIKANLRFGDQAWRVEEITRFGEDCVMVDDETSCFLTQADYAQYINANTLECNVDEKSCISDPMSTPNYHCPNYDNDEGDVQVITITKLPPEGYLFDPNTPSSRHITLTLQTKTGKDVKDPNIWIYNHGFNGNVRFPYTTESYRFDAEAVDTQYDYEYNRLILTSENDTTVFDFKSILNQFERIPFINYALVKNDILYVQFSHNSSADVNGDTAFIMALDIINGTILWRSQSLACNAANFVIIDETIVCGYGYTKENDYIYTLDLNTGRTVDKITTDSAPGFIMKKDNMLYISTYNKGYIYKY